MPQHRIYYGDNLPILQSLPSESVDLIYIDPPFNTGRTQARTQIRTERSQNGSRVGFAGRRYETIKIGQKAYADLFDDYQAFLEPRLVEARRLLKPQGSLYFHIDYREGITARCCWTKSLGESASSTRSFGPMITVPARARVAGQA